MHCTYSTTEQCRRKLSTKLFKLFKSNIFVLLHFLSSIKDMVGQGIKVKGSVRVQMLVGLSELT